MRWTGGGAGQRSCYWRSMPCPTIGSAPSRFSSLWFEVLGFPVLPALAKELIL